MVGGPRPDGRVRRPGPLDRPAVTSRGAEVTHFFDLLDDPAAPEEWVDRLDGPKYPAPADPPAFEPRGTAPPGPGRGFGYY